MSLSYCRLMERPLVFLRLSGVKVEEFQEICERVQPLWEEVIEKKKKRHGRTSRLKSFEGKLLALLVYYRTYITHEFIGYLFGLHNANICRLFKKLEPLVAKKLTIKKDRTLTQKEVLKLLADVTEQPTQRPTKKKKKQADLFRQEETPHFKRRKLSCRIMVGFFRPLIPMEDGRMILKSENKKNLCTQKLRSM